MTELTASDGHTFNAYEVHPEGATAAVVIVQEIFGVNAHIRSVVDGYAALGVRAIAPAVFDRVRPGIELGYDEEGIKEGVGYAGEIASTALTDIGVAHVAPTGPVAVIGYCFGGSMAWRSAAELPIAAAVGYYGGHVPGAVDLVPKVPTLLHFGELDAGIPLDGVRAVDAAHPDVPVHIYEGADHGFNCDARASHHPEAAALALARTIAFLQDAGFAIGSA